MYFVSNSLLCAAFTQMLAIPADMIVVSVAACFCQPVAQPRYGWFSVFDTTTSDFVFKMLRTMVVVVVVACHKTFVLGVSALLLLLLLY